MTISALSDSVVSPLGIGSETNFAAVRSGNSGISRVKDPALSSEPFFASRIHQLDVLPGFTRFESLAIQSIQDALKKAPEIDLKKTAFVLSTTKGNVELLGSVNHLGKGLLLHQTAHKIARHSGIGKSYVVSNACASGLMAIMLGKQLLEAGSFAHVVVTGADVLSRFVVSGFQSLYALSDEPCKPFDASRKGLNLGEASATLILSAVHRSEYAILGSAATNDANHISGPSRTGEELGAAITLAKASGLEIDFISAHGTATLYNDEMEAKAFHQANVQELPMNSLKGYFGHTLGASGLVETIMSLQSLKQDELIASKGYELHGVSLPLNVIRRTVTKKLTAFLKTASGFGGCNAAIVIGKSN